MLIRPASWTMAGIVVCGISFSPTLSFAADPDPAEEVTFAADVAPILQQNCQICHQPGGLGPMSLMTYEEVKPWADVIRLRVQDREMPPYQYDTDVGIQELKIDWRMSEKEIATIAQWVEAGTPMGDPADLPPPVEWPDPREWKLAGELGEPDHVIRSTPYTVPANGQNVWWKPIIEHSGITEERCIKAMEVKPSVTGRAAVHHAVPYWLIPNDEGGFDKFLGTEYALGKRGEIVPDDACRKMPPDLAVEWDVHYSPIGTELKDDVVELGIWFNDEEPEYEQTMTNYGLQGGIDLLAPHSRAMTQGFHSFDHPVRIDSFQPHGHLRLAAKSLEIYYPEEGRREVISMVSNWNPGWQHNHIYDEDAAPLVPAGAVIILTAWYDNTADNPHNPDPGQWVTRGNRTTDEMSHAWLAITHLDEDRYQELLSARDASQQADSTESVAN